MSVNYYIGIGIQTEWRNKTFSATRYDEVTGKPYIKEITQKTLYLKRTDYEIPIPEHSEFTILGDLEQIGSFDTDDFGSCYGFTIPAPVTSNTLTKYLEEVSIIFKNKLNCPCSVSVFIAYFG